MNLSSFGSRIVLVLFIVTGGAGGQTNLDLILRNGRIVDGTGRPAYRGDLGMKGSRIVAVGVVTNHAPRELDVSSCVIAPGFVDVHTHADSVEEHPLAENFVRMGVTTIVVGNCGSSVLELGKFFDRLERTNVAVNVASLIGHGSVRAEVMGGSLVRPPNAMELQKMSQIVERAMKEGAVGLSTGLIYLPGTFAKTGELTALARVIAPFQGIYASHMRDEGEKITEAISEVFEIARTAGVRAEISHLKLSGKTNWHRTNEVLRLLETARKEGLEVTQDIYVYDAASTSLSQLIPEDFRAEGKFRENLEDLAQRKAMISAMKERLKKNSQKDYSYVNIAECSSDSQLNGLNIREAALRRGGDGSVDGQIQLILEMQKAGGASAIFHSMSEADMRAFFFLTNTMVASDSGSRVFGTGMPHPRGYGNNARVLARYVRGEGAMQMEEAIRKMSSLPANTYHLEGRGRLAPGYFADVVVFNPAEVKDNATYAAPHQYATGFRLICVNGVVVLEADHSTGARPGRALRGGKTDLKKSAIPSLNVRLGI